MAFSMLLLRKELTDGKVTTHKNGNKTVWITFWDEKVTDCGWGQSNKYDVP